MARIDRVDYVAMPGQAKKMRENALELNSELKAAYSIVAEMHNAWYGIRYNELVKDFNGLVEQINELLDLVVTKVPFTIETIANNYSKADKDQNVVSAEETAVNKIEELYKNKYDAVVFLCYERPDSFCHRHILRSLMNKIFIIPCEELEVPTKENKNNTASKTQTSLF